MIKLDKKHSGVFAAGVLFGTAGIKLLSSKDAKKVGSITNFVGFPIPLVALSAHIE